MSKLYQNLALLGIVVFSLVFLLTTGISSANGKKHGGKDNHGVKNMGVTEEELGIRKKSLYDEKDVTPVKGDRDFKSPGDSTKIKRAFENSPPLIPHDITGMLPIALTNNACMDCHLPKNVTFSGAVAIPKSHFMSLGKHEPVKDDTTDSKSLNMGANKEITLAVSDELNGERYNCMQCHVQQIKLPVAVENMFKEEFRTERSKHNSNLIEILNEGVK